MAQWTEIQQIVYDILMTQIECGIYRYQESLPTLEETSGQFHVSVDTARSAYRRLQREGYISLTKNIGAKVIVQFEEEEIDRHINTFLSIRKDALIDLSKSFRSLFANAQWVGLKHASPETLERLDRLCRENDESQAPHATWQCLQEKYAALGNDLLIRLAWQVYMFFHMIVFSFPNDQEYLDHVDNHIPRLLTFCRQQDWQALRDTLNQFHDKLAVGICHFYEAHDIRQSPEQRLAFCWDSYKKPSQRCYSLSMELLISINRGYYPVGSYLPTAAQLSLEKGVSVSTVRRAIGLLSSIGAVKSSRPLGARVLPFDQCLENCDFSQPALQRRLIDMAQSLQFFTLSCKAVSELTLVSLDSDTIRQWRKALSTIKELGYYELLDYNVLDLLARFAPYQAIRTVYSEILRQLFWGNPLRGMKGNREKINAFYGPYIDQLMEALNEPDITQYSTILEAFFAYELRVTVKFLFQLKIPGAGKLLIPDESDLR